ncbi:hypothetical protein [Shewanella surugensis]|uniref:Uncharacterized protein n=1 Tax=Shewanella surugensis TaxID=212020 RepID=A0ABT0LF86_9GAMM|nr:hypothetical protein [Shewanella surugensis]MCL1125997.1 hypothetical protein [Shewanella surugensis]
MSLSFTPSINSLCMQTRRGLNGGRLEDLTTVIKSVSDAIQTVRNEGHTNAVERPEDCKIFIIR